MTWDWHYAWTCLPFLLDGLQVACLASVGGFVLALGFGIAAALGLRGWRSLARLLDATLTVIRSTPLLIQLYLAFYALPQFGLTMAPLTTGILVLGLHYCAYVSEIVRAGIDQVPAGQWDACRALGLKPTTTWWSVILPQALRPMLPALANQFVAMLKDTPLLSTITVVELLGAARMLGSEHFRYLEPVTLVGVLFLAVSLCASGISHRLERFTTRSLRV